MASSQTPPPDQPEPGSVVHENETPNTPRILIVEDEFIVSMEMESALAEAGFTVVGVANSADQAVQYAVRERPDLVIMDIRLIGQRDGIDAAIEISRSTGIRCVFATAHRDVQTLARAEAAAPLGWLTKPYTRDMLIEAVTRALLKLRG